MVVKTLNSVYSVKYPCSFKKDHFHNVVSTFTNAVKVDFENDNIVSTLSNVVHSNVETHNVDSTFFDVVNSKVEIDKVASTLI